MNQRIRSIPKVSALSEQTVMIRNAKRVLRSTVAFINVGFAESWSPRLEYHLCKIVSDVR